MDLSFIGKLSTIFKYIFSSFLPVEMLLLSLALFVILVVNVNKKNKFVQSLSLGVYIGFVLGVVISYTTYVKTCVDSFVKIVMNYIYFPSTVVYFFIIVFVTIIMLFSIFSNKISNFKKIFNYLFFSLMYFFFMAFISLAAIDGVDLMDTSILYENNIILSLIQISNLLLVVWILFTFFYQLFLYFKKRYD